jgi:predicted aldo/keto reductase-like oxidoreductase
MQVAQYGQEGPEISRLGFGVMRLPPRKAGAWDRVNFTRSVALMRAAMAGGVNFFDSHHRYHAGNSEVAIGRALKGWKGQRIYLQTKTPWYNDEPNEVFEKMLYEALEKLGVDCIDYLLHHSLRMETWKKRGRKFLKFTDWAMNRGLIRHRGFSSHDTPAHIREYIDTGEFACMLVSYNWMNPQVRDVIAHAADRGMGVTVMNPIGGGTLATSTPEVLRLVRGARSASEISLRYVLATPGVTCALSGMNAMSQLEENLAVASRRTPLTETQQTRMEERLRGIQRAQREFCTGCGYCMTCPHGVDIPANFRLLNQARYFGRWDWARAEYRKLRKHADGDASAAACERCGTCEPKCPNDVPIMDQLEEVAEALG